jgi:hypothetical protein
MTSSVEVVLEINLIRIGIGNLISQRSCEILLKKSHIIFSYLSFKDNCYFEDDFHVNIHDIRSFSSFHCDDDDSPSANPEDISYLVAIRASPNAANRLSSLEDHYINDRTFENLSNEEGSQSPKAYLTFEFATAEDYESFVTQAKTLYKDEEVLFGSIPHDKLPVYAKAMIENGDMQRKKRMHSLMLARSPKEVPLFNYPFYLTEQEELLATKDLTEIDFIFRPRVSNQIVSGDDKLPLFSRPVSIYESDRSRLVTIVQGEYLYLNDTLINFVILWYVRCVSRAIIMFRAFEVLFFSLPL